MTNVHVEGRGEVSLSELSTESLIHLAESMPEAAREIVRRSKTDKARWVIPTQASGKDDTFPNEDYDNKGHSELVHNGVDTASRSMVQKGRVYLRPGGSAPSGVKVEVGPRGGRYYDAEAAAAASVEPIDTLDLLDRAAEFSQRVTKYRQWVRPEEWKAKVGKRLAKSLKKNPRLKGYDPDTVLAHLTLMRRDGYLAENFGDSYAKYWKELDSWNKVSAGLINTWAQSSADHHQLSIGIQQSVSKIFNVEVNPSLAEYLDSERFQEAMKNVLDTPMGDSDLTLRPLIEEFVKETYEITQQELKDAGFDELVLFRGMVWNNSFDIPEWADEPWKSVYGKDSYTGVSIMTEDGLMEVGEELPFTTMSFFVGESSGEHIRIGEILPPLREMFSSGDAYFGKFADGNWHQMTEDGALVARVRDPLDMEAGLRSLPDFKRQTFDSDEMYVAYRHGASREDEGESFGGSVSEVYEEIQRRGLEPRGSAGYSGTYATKVNGVPTPLLAGRVKQMLADNFSHTEDAEISLNPASSFSSSIDTAYSFSGRGGVGTVVIMGAVPREQVLSFFGSGWGCSEEDEFVLIGPTVKNGKALFGSGPTGNATPENVKRMLMPTPPEYEAVVGKTVNLGYDSGPYHGECKVVGYYPRYNTFIVQNVEFGYTLHVDTATVMNGEFV